MLCYAVSISFDLGDDHPFPHLSLVSSSLKSFLCWFVSVMCCSQWLAQDTHSMPDAPGSGLIPRALSTSSWPARHYRPLTQTQIHHILFIEHSSHTCLRCNNPTGLLTMCNIQSHHKSFRLHPRHKTELSLDQKRLEELKVICWDLDEKKRLNLIQNAWWLHSWTWNNIKYIKWV